MIAFNAVLAYLILGRPISNLRKAAIGVVMFGLIINSLGGSNSASVTVFGIALTILGTVVYALEYVLIERLLKQKPDCAGKPEFTGAFIGIQGCLISGSWILFYTVPHLDTLFVDRVEADGGSYILVLIAYIALFASHFVNAWAYYRLMSSKGATSTSILQVVRTAGIFFLSGFLYCSRSEAQCLTWTKFFAALVMIGGATFFVMSPDAVPLDSDSSSRTPSAQTNIIDLSGQLQ